MQLSRICRGTNQQKAKKILIDPPGVEKLSKRQELSRSIHQVSRSYRDCNKKKPWEARQTERYRGGVELAFQNSFSRGERHRQECNQECNSTNNPINHIQLSKSFLIIIFKHMDLKHTHTHTHTHTYTHTHTKQV